MSKHTLAICDLQVQDTVEYKGKPAVVLETHNGRHGMRYKLLTGDTVWDNKTVWVFESEFVFGTYPVYRRVVNAHGFTDMCELHSDGFSSPVCVQCKACVMPNRGSGMLCDSCAHEFDLHCEHDNADI